MKQNVVFSSVRTLCYMTIVNYNIASHIKISTTHKIKGANNVS